MNNLKFILILCALGYIGFVQAQITAIPDPIFEQYLIDFGFDSDGIINGQVLTSDIDWVGTLEINETPPFYFINDFTGIQDFTSLEWFFFVGTNVVELNISNLTNLRYIEGISNFDLALIDISGCEILETFIMSGTSLSTIHLPQAETLEDFYSTNGLLTDLDLSFYPNLTDVSVNRNVLQSLNVANGNNSNIIFFSAIENPDLLCIFVDDVAYSEENWTSIDTASTFVETQEECDMLSIHESSFLDFKVYPNPARDFFKINGVTAMERIDIIDLAGKVVKSFTESQDEYPVTGLSKGVYIINIHTDFGKSFQKLIIE